MLNFPQNIFDLSESKCSKFREIRLIGCWFPLGFYLKNCNFHVFLDRLIGQVMGITDEADFLTQHF